MSPRALTRFRAGRPFPSDSETDASPDVDGQQVWAAQKRERATHGRNNVARSLSAPRFCPIVNALRKTLSAAGEKGERNQTRTVNTRLNKRWRTVKRSGTLRGALQKRPTERTTNRSRAVGKRGLFVRGRDAPIYAGEMDDGALSVTRLISPYNRSPGAL